MAVEPLNIARVSNLLRSNLLLDNIRSNTVDLLRAQTQMSTGMRVNRPSDDPGAAVSSLHIDQLLDAQNQHLENLRFAGNFLSTMDTALGDVADLLLEAQTTASSSIGVTASDEQRQANAALVSGMIDQLVAIANRKFQDTYIFGGTNSTVAPFSSSGSGGVQYNGQLDELSTVADRSGSIPYSFNGHEVFGALSSRVRGAVDLDPNLTTDTRLSDLDGTLGEGIRLGSIIVSDGSNAAVVDLTGAATVGDVIDAIESATPATIHATINSTGDGIRIYSDLPTDDITVVEVGAGTTAHDLGIFNDSGAGGDLQGADVNVRLTVFTPLSALRAGAGVDATGLKITNGLTTVTVSLSGLQTVGDLLNAINQAGVGVIASINADADGIDVLNRQSGTQMFIGEAGGSTATQLGIRSLAGYTTLAELNGGAGVGTVDGADIRITLHDGTVVEVDLSGAETVQDVIDAINAVAPTTLVAALTGDGNGIELRDTSIGSNDFVVANVNFSTAATDLGIAKSISPGENVLVGDDVNPIKPDGMFSHLYELYEALMDGDSARITAAGEKLKEDYDRAVRFRAEAGARLADVESRQQRLQDTIVQTRALRSDLLEVDFTEAITRFQTIQAALQANLIAGSHMLDLSLMDFLR